MKLSNLLVAILFIGINETTGTEPANYTEFAMFYDRLIPAGFLLFHFLFRRFESFTDFFPVNYIPDS